MNILEDLISNGLDLLENVIRPSPMHGPWSAPPHPRTGRRPPLPKPLIEVIADILVDGARTITKTALKAGTFSHGEHIKTLYGAYSHHGIYIGNDRVIHLSKETGRVVMSCLDTFRDGRVQIWVVASPRTIPETEVVRRAESRLGESGYDLFNNNCEHFCNWCRSGKRTSKQLERWVG